MVGETKQIGVKAESKEEPKLVEVSKRLVKNLFELDDKGRYYVRQHKMLEEQTKFSMGLEKLSASDLSQEGAAFKAAMELAPVAPLIPKEFKNVLVLMSSSELASSAHYIALKMMKYYPVAEEHDRVSYATGDYLIDSSASDTDYGNHRYSLKSVNNGAYADILKLLINNDNVNAIGDGKIPIAEMLVDQLGSNLKARNVAFDYDATGILKVLGNAGLNFNKVNSEGNSLFTELASEMGKSAFHPSRFDTSYLANSEVKAGDYNRMMRETEKTLGYILEKISPNTLVGDKDADVAVWNYVNFQYFARETEKIDEMLEKLAKGGGKELLSKILLRATENRGDRELGWDIPEFRHVAQKAFELGGDPGINLEVRGRVGFYSDVEYVGHKNILSDISTINSKHVSGDTYRTVTDEAALKTIKEVVKMFNLTGDQVAELAMAEENLSGDDYITNLERISRNRWKDTEAYIIELGGKRLIELQRSLITTREERERIAKEKEEKHRQAQEAFREAQEADAKEFWKFWRK